MKFFPITPFLPIFVSGYYLSPNELSRDAAEQFCQSICHSHLSSFHSVDDYTKAIETTTNNEFLSSDDLQSNDVWIGLTYANNTNEWIWSDSSLDFASNIDQNPWISDVLSLDSGLNKHCAVLSASFDYKLESKECDNKNMFLCNSCDSIINKYIVISTENLNYTQSNNKCNNYLGTSLASIHNENDHNQTKLLCSLATNGDDKSCWIGLNDRENEGEYKWIDNTTFDFGSDISGGVYPWSIEYIDGNVIKQPNAYDININCVDLWQKQNYSIDRFDFNDDDCGINQPFICNLPSTICKHENWHKISGSWIFDDKLCNLYNLDYITSDKESVILMDVMNNNWNGNIIIDYMFKIFDVRDIGGIGGIEMHFNDHTFFIGFIISPNGQYIHLVLSHNENVQLKSVNMTNMYNIGYFYSLKIELTQENVMKIYINDKLYIQYLMDLVHIPENHALHRFGIRNDRLSIHAKSLYISGSTMSFDNNPITTNTKIPTITTPITDINNLYNSSNLSTTKLQITINDSNHSKLFKVPQLQSNVTKTTQTVTINGNNNNETNNTDQNLVTLTITDFIFILIGVIASVCIILCGLCCCLLYIKKLLLSNTFKGNMIKFAPPPDPAPLNHIPADSLPSCLETENVLQTQGNIELKITQDEYDTKNINDISINIHNNDTINGNGYTGSKVSNSSALYDDYVTKGSEFVNVLNIPLPKSPVCRESMNEGYDRKQFLRLKYNANTPTTSISDLFGSQYQHKSENAFLKIPNRDNIGYYSSENEILKDEEEDSSHDEIDGNQTTLSL